MSLNINKYLFFAVIIAAGIMHCGTWTYDTFFDNFSPAAYRQAPAPTCHNSFGNLPTLETKHLILRPVTASDAENCMAFFADEYALKYMPFQPKKSTAEMEKAISYYTKQYLEQKPAPWAVVLKATGHVIGLCGFYDWKPTSARAELMSILARSHWNQGYITEAKRAVIAYGFEHMKLNSIIAYVHPDNKASLHINTKLGFKVVGIIPEFCYYKGAYWDRVCMVLLNPKTTS